MDYFPEYVPNDPDPRLAKITLRDLLMMSSGFGCSYLMNERRAGVGLPNYVAYMMSREMRLEPGAKFHYSNGDTILVGRMAAKAVGMPMGEYLYQRMFASMDMGWPAWEHDPTGHAFEASGLYLTLKEMMKLGQLYISDGVWNGMRLLSHDWVVQATSKQIDTQGSTPDMSSGYGYQMWMNPYPESCRADGAHGQMTVMLPKCGLVVGIQCHESDGGDNYEKVRPIFFNEFVPEVMAQI